MDIDSCKDKSVEAHDIDSESLNAIRTLLQNQHGHHADEFKAIGVSFEDLTIAVPGELVRPVKTLPTAIVNTFGPDQYQFLKSKIVDRLRQSHVVAGGKTILSGVSGLVRPGEMLLVLGRPGSGCSTFLRAAANQSSLRFTGDIRFGNIDAAEFERLHRRETLYLPEEDSHIAPLTVRETIQFALRASLPSRSRTTALVEELVITITGLFGLSHALDTPVGGAFAPGVSGGERKRVSIAEVLAAGSSVQCFDNSTRGLDSSTALDFVKALRVLTDVGQKTTLATLYQAGENIYRHFDKVLLLDSGREVFFGPTGDARAYFENLGFVPAAGQTTAEFLSSVTDPASRTARPGTPAASIATPDDLASAFVNSEPHASLRREIERYRESVATAHLPPGTSYNLSYPQQVMECLRREYQLARRLSRVYHIKWITTVILCLTCGSVYFDISNNAQGAFTRGGILYFALIFNGWLQFPELFNAHTTRDVLERQSRLHLYRPSAVALARFLIDLPLIAFQHVLFILPFYFLTRLQLDAGKFFFFYLTLLISTVNFSNLLRMFAYYVETLDDCFRYGGFSCTVLLLFAGFLIPARDMRPYFGWLHWLNPMYYGFENLFVNEFSGLEIVCDRNELIPSTGDDIDLAHQVCAFPGAVAGQGTISGSAYADVYGFAFSHRWRNIGIMIAIALAYLAIGAIGSEIMRFTSRGGSPLLFAKRWTPLVGPSGHVRDVEKEASAASSSTSIDSKSPLGEAAIVLSWKDLSVDIDDKRILNGISGYVKRGELTALCGASGAGKTTLLSHLSQTNFSGTRSGEVLFERSPVGPAFHKVTGFAQQNDLHDGTATVREALEFSAILRQPPTYSAAEKLVHVESVLTLLDLHPVADALIGDDNSGLSLEQKRRVTIGVELAARPQILFADEPTSGLDSQGAAQIVRYLRHLARQGQAVLVTVHQPSALIFSEFDNLLALSSDGEGLFFGKVSAALPYFERHGAICPQGANPAEFILETVGAGVKSDRGVDWAARWRDSPESLALAHEIEASKQFAPTRGNDSLTVSTYNASCLLQIRLLTLRMLKNQWRNTPYIYSKIWVHAISAILVGLTFLNLGTSPEDLQNRAFSAYFVLFLVNAIVNVILARYFFASLYWRFREGPSRTYSWVAFTSSVILAELPAALFVTVLYFVIWYFPSGLPTREGGYIFLFLFTYEVFQLLLGLFIMAVSPDLGFAGNILVFIVCTFNWFNGIIVPYDQIQLFWRSWLYYLSPFTYFLGGTVTAVVQGLPVECSPEAISRFDPPAGQTCGQYAGQWASDAAAQLLNPDAVADCAVCKWTTGDQYLQGFNLGKGGLLGGRWEYYGVFVLFTFVNLGLVFFFTWATKVKGWKLFYFF